MPKYLETRETYPCESDEVMLRLSSIEIQNYAREYPVTPVFNVGTGGSIVAPLVIHDGRIYCASCDHNLYALNMKGEELWRFGTEGPLLSSFHVDNERIVLPSSDRNIYCLNLKRQAIVEIPGKWFSSVRASRS